MDPNPQGQSGEQSTQAKSSRNTFLTLAIVLIVCVIIVILLILYVLRILNTKSGKNAVPTPTPASTQGTIRSADGTVYKLAQRTNIPKTVICAKFTDLKSALQDIESACVLDLSGQNLSTLPPEITRLTNLVEIDLNKNNFTEFPTLLYEIKKLSVVQLSDNKISIFPEKIWDMKELTALLLSNNQLTSIPIPKQFNTLKTLLIDGNKIPHSQIEELKKFNPMLEVKE